MNKIVVLKHAVLALVVTLITSLSAEAGFIGKFQVPDGPDAQKTPGELCQRGYPRYDQRITYCERDVNGTTKAEIIAEYDTELGFDVRKLPRNDFKIDHFIPLSIGGANSKANLWPQHKSVYVITDPIESLVATLISQNKISQKDAIQAVKDCKLQLSNCEKIEDHLRSLL